MRLGIYFMDINVECHVMTFKCCGSLHVFAHMPTNICCMLTLA